MTEDDLDQIIYTEALDETGTVATEGLTDSDDESSNTTEGEEWESLLRGVDEDLLHTHGTEPGEKDEGVTRVIYENLNGINNRISSNDKLDKAKEIINDLEADIVAYNEHRINLRHKENKNGFSQMFTGGEADIRSVAAHNVHENVGKVQEGGTALLAYGPIIEHLDLKGSGKDVF